MQNYVASQLFHHLSYWKPAKEIKEAAAKKAKELTAKIEDRRRRIAVLRVDNGIDDRAMIELLQAVRQNSKQTVFTYTSSAPAHEGSQENAVTEKTITAGIASALFAEDDAIKRELDLVSKLNFICRNLEEIPAFSETGTPLPPRGFLMDTGDLEFLGF
jgi:hypothetical protein